MAAADITVGGLLGGSIRLVLRHWVILLVGMFVLAEVCLLNLSLLGRCFGAYASGCPSFITTLGAPAEWLISSVTHETTGVIVTSVAIYFLYSGKRIDVPGAAVLRKSRTQAMRLLARLALVAIVILVPLHLFDTVLSEAVTAFPEFEGSEAMGWLIYVLRTIAIVAFSGYVRARLVLYVPAGAYAPEPETWRESWKRTGPDATRLFIFFFLFGFVTSIAQIGVMMLAYQVPGYLTAVDVLSGFLDVRSSYILQNLAQAIAFVVVGVPGTLIEAAASLVAFKALMPAEEQATADIFS